MKFCEVFNYVILGIIIALIIHLLIKLMDERQKKYIEGMCSAINKQVSNDVQPKNEAVLDDTDKKILDYQDNYLDFRSKINQESNTSIDLVDKINELYLSGNSDISRSHNGMAIKDLFKTLTSDNKPNETNYSCIKVPTEIDVIAKEARYKVPEANGMAYTQDLWQYEDEKVQNGGAFMENVLPNDLVIDKYKSVQ